MLRIQFPRERRWLQGKKGDKVETEGKTMYQELAWKGLQGKQLGPHCPSSSEQPWFLYFPRVLESLSSKRRGKVATVGTSVWARQEAAFSAVGHICVV